MKAPSRRVTIGLVGYSIAFYFQVQATRDLIRLTLAGQGVLLLWIVWVGSVVYMTYCINKLFQERGNKS